MIESKLKDKVVAITSYCDSPEKIDVLVRNIRLLRIKFPEFKIAVHANYPLDPTIQRMVDIYIFEDLNHIATDKWIYYWNIITDGGENGVPYFRKRFFYSILDTGFSVFQQIKSLTKYLVDYKWVMLINYDTSVEEIKIEDYTEEYDLTLHYFPGQRAVSLIMMYYRPQVFLDKVCKFFNYETWMLPEMTDKLNEERFFDMINQSGIKYFAHNHKVSDKISNEPDYLRPNSPTNPFFTNYLLVKNDNDELELYIWGLTQLIKTIALEINDEIHIIPNHNSNMAFDYIYSNPYHKKIEKVEIVGVNDVCVNIPLRIKKGYSTKDI